MNASAVALTRLLLALPILSLALGAVAWLRYGIDLPWFDDWRGYLDGTIDSLKAQHLFRAVNNTLSPVGFALDALAQRYLDGNSIVYQFLSMVLVLGSLLWLQWKLLLLALDNKLQAAMCFSLCVLMLQPGSYWGMENLAYQQALPLVFLLAALLIILRGAGHPALRRGALTVLTGLAGFSYISGAFAGLAAGVTLLVAGRAFRLRESRPGLTGDAVVVTVIAAVATSIQVYLSVLNYRSGLGLAWPHTAEFWAFYFGKISRSLLLPHEAPMVSSTGTLVACAIALAAAALLSRRALAQASGQREKTLVTLYLTLGVVVVVYLGLIAAGRAKLRPEGADRLIDIFEHAFWRFHFFWATLIWPWVLAACLQVWTNHRGNGPTSPVTVAAVVAALIVLPAAAGAYDHMRSHRESAQGREVAAECLLTQLQLGGEVRCKGLLPPLPSEPAPDAYPAYLYARSIGASFVRRFPVLEDVSRRDTIAPFYRAPASNASFRLHDLVHAGNGNFRVTGPDPRLYLRTEKPEFMHRCETLDVEVDIRTSRRDTARLYFAPIQKPHDYWEPRSVSAEVGIEGDGWHGLSFRLHSEQGFFETLRFDPVTKVQEFEIGQIKAYCLRERLAYRGPARR